MKDWDFESRRTRVRERFRRRGAGGGSAVRLVLGLATIGLGVLFFLDNLYWIDARPVLRFWPAAVVLALGAASFYQARRLTLAVGLWSLAGCWLLLDALHITDIDFWEAVVPLGLVLLGIRLLTRGLRQASPGADAGAPVAAVGTDSSGDESLSAFAMMAAVRRSSHSRSLRRVDVVALMGGVEIDLTHAAPLAGGTVEIDASTIWGGIEIWVPTDWVVDFRPFALMAGAEDQTVRRRPTSSDAPVDGSRPRVIVRGFALMGAIEIKNRPNPTLGA